jgi:hypothetical protein
LIGLIVYEAVLIEKECGLEDPKDTEDHTK